MPAATAMPAGGPGSRRGGGAGASPTGPGSGPRSRNTRWRERGPDGPAALERGDTLPTLRAEPAALRLGGAALIAHLGDPICEIGRSLTAHTLLPWTAVAGAADGAVGGIPTRPARAERGYDVERARCIHPEFAASPGISEHATLRHVERVVARPGVNRRGQIAAWVPEHPYEPHRTRRERAAASPRGLAPGSLRPRAGPLPEQSATPLPVARRRNHRNRRSGVRCRASDPAAVAIGDSASHRVLSFPRPPCRPPERARHAPVTWRRRHAPTSYCFREIAVRRRACVAVPTPACPNRRAGMGGPAAASAPWTG